MREAREGGLDHAQRLALRREKSKPVFDDIGNWMVENHKEVLPKSAIGKATHYLVGRFNYLLRILKDG